MKIVPPNLDSLPSALSAKPRLKFGKFILVVLGLLWLASIGQKPSTTSSSGSVTSTEARIRAAISAEYHCSWLREYRSAGRDETGTVYFADCNDYDRLYMVFFNPAGRAKVTPIPVGKVRR